MKASRADVRKVDTTGLALVCDHLDMTVWDDGDGRIVRVGDRTRSLEDARAIFDAYDTAHRVTGVTPRPYEVVQVGDRFGVVVEWVRGFSLGAHLKFGSYSPSEAGEALGEIALLLHRAHAHTGCDMRALFIAMAQRIAPYVPDDQARRLVESIRGIPAQDTLLHGDIHPGNVIVNRDGLRLIDMDTVGFGHPVFELACMNAFIFRGVPIKIEEFGMTPEEGVAAAKVLWEAALRRYFSGWDADEVSAASVRIEILARLTRCFGGPKYLEADNAFVDHWMQENIGAFRVLLRDALPQVDRLDF